jgi:hypothetical protein
MQVVLVASMCAAFRDKLIGKAALTLAIVALIIPMAVGETNVVFIWLPLAVATVFFDQISRRPAVFLFGAAALAGLMVALGMAYLLVQQTNTTGPGQTIDQRIREVYEYNLGSRGYVNATDVNRLTVIPHWVSNNGLHSPVQSTFGHGVGASFGSVEVRSPLRAKFGGRSIDLVTVSAFLWDLGVVGTALYLSVVGFACRSAYRLSNVARAGVDRAIARSLFAGTIMLFSLGFYNNAIVTTSSQQVIAMMILGLTAWMERRYAATDRRPRPVARPAESSAPATARTAHSG